MGGRSAALILGGIALSVGAPLPAAEAPPPPGLTQLEEISVTGERPGPRLWKVSREDHVLWLLGTLTHIPRKMTWRSTQVETALGSSQELLDSGFSISASIGPISAVRLYFQFRHTERTPEHTTLKTWVPPPLYARFEQVKSNFDNSDRSIEDLRPSAAALRLYDKAVDAAGLTERETVEQQVVRLARKLRVPVQRPKFELTNPSDTLKQVGDLSPALEVDCLDATVTRIETDLQNMQQRALAWSVGDVDRLRALPFPNQREVCINAISNAPRIKEMVDRAAQLWMDEAEAALRRNRVTFAMRPIYDLLDVRGPLAKFRAEGYSVEGP
ncbi:MAG TPA: TraB/GumN family protein [Steroidobacteraceae bacterium]|jgi:uncharacterized protein YbaP (TraB family)|nr:TraB/GumN family protein [Steroidobacteraceae bacterium]